jgi:hypothetical protein
MKKNLLKKVLALTLSTTMVFAPVVSYAGDEITEEVVWEETIGDENQNVGEEENYGEEAGIEESSQLYSIPIKQGPENERERSTEGHKKSSHC